MRDIGWQKLTFSNTGAGSNIAPDSPNASWHIDIEDAEEILVFAETTTANHAAHTSADWDLNFFIGFFAGEARDGTLMWESTASASEDGLGDNATYRIRVEDSNGNTLSGQRLKILADCNANNLEADVYVWVRKRQRN